MPRKPSPAPYLETWERFPRHWRSELVERLVLAAATLHGAADVSPAVAYRLRRTAELLLEVAYQVPRQPFRRRPKFWGGLAPALDFVTQLIEGVRAETLGPTVLRDVADVARLLADVAAEARHAVQYWEAATPTSVLEVARA